MKYHKRRKGLKTSFQTSIAEKIKIEKWAYNSISKCEFLHVLWTKLINFAICGDWTLGIVLGAKMATSLVKEVAKQELPPKGGYPAIVYARNIPTRGPSGIALFLGGAAVMAYGFYRVIMGNRKRW